MSKANTIIKSGAQSSATAKVGGKPATARQPSVEEHVRGATNTSGTPVESATLRKMEAQFGRSFGDVRIHADERAGQAAQALGASAFTSGSSIVFANGEYNPATTQGQLLLAHELAHVAHNRSSPSRRPGIAPQSSMAEMHADTAARVALDGGPAVDVRGWGPAWAVHRQVDKITKKGKQEHSGEIGRKPGETGVPIGSIEVRTGEDIEFKGGAKLPNVISLAYSGSFAPDTHWLQFVWFELIALLPSGLARVAATIPTTSGTKPFTTDPTAPNWSIDTASSTSPFYEAAGANLRDASSIVMFDAPGGGSATPLADAVFNAGLGATGVIFSAHFETFLIQSNATMYQVNYSASTAFLRPPTLGTVAGAIGYTVGTAKQVSALPAHHKTMLDAAFPAFKAIK